MDFRLVILICDIIDDDFIPDDVAIHNGCVDVWHAGLVRRAVFRVGRVTQSWALCLGYQILKGPYVVILDSDDLQEVLIGLLWLFGPGVEAERVLERPALSGRWRTGLLGRWF